MSDDKIEQAVFKIFQMTHLGQLEWIQKAAPKSLHAGTDSVFPYYFETQFQGRTLALFSERYRTRERLAASNLGLATLFEDADKERWIDKNVLALLSDEGQLAFEFSSSRQVRDLMSTVRRKASGVDQFLDDLLNTEPSKA